MAQGYAVLPRLAFNNRIIYPSTPRHHPEQHRCTHSRQPGTNRINSCLPPCSSLQRPGRRHAASFCCTARPNQVPAGRNVSARAAADAGLGEYGGAPSSRKGLGAHLESIPVIGPPLAASYRQLKLFQDLKSKFLPMVALFFCLSFVNTVLDSLKDTLVITAAGGGAEVIPYLTVYAVLPSSVLFLLAFAVASQHLSRAALFNAIVTIFMGFFAFFGLVLYPNIDVLHPQEFADGLSKFLPQGLAGGGWCKQLPALHIALMISLHPEGGGGVILIS